MMNKRVKYRYLASPPPTLKDHIYTMLISDIMETESAARKIGQYIK